MPTFGFKNSSGIDIGASLVDKSYLLDRYPEFVDQYRFAGLYGCGINLWGALGTGVQLNYSDSFIETVSKGTQWKQVSGGQDFTGAIKSDGTLWMWGSDLYRQIGIGAGVFFTNKSSPIQTTAGGTDWKQVSCGENHVGAIKNDGTLWTWGNGGSGQLGLSSTSNKNIPSQSGSYASIYKQVSCGYNHTCVTTKSGTLLCTGYNGYGQLGTGNTSNLSDLTQTVAGGTDWKQVSGGGTHTGAIKTDGTLWTWGDNTYGQLGDESIIHRSSPVQTIAGGTNWKQVACGNNFTGAIKTDGTLWLWGRNNLGQLGTNSTTDRSSPMQTIAGGTSWKDLSCGKESSGCIKTDGTLWMWGGNTMGTLGFGDRVHRSSPTQHSGYNWKQVACSLQHSIVIRNDADDLL